MKNLTVEFFYGGNAKAAAFLIVGILAFAGLDCSGVNTRSSYSSPTAPPPPAYVGDWKAEDGSTLAIRGNSKGDYKSGATTVDGGTIAVDEIKKELSITFFGIGPTLKIDSPPADNKMKLNGLVYRRSDAPQP